MDHGVVPRRGAHPAPSQIFGKNQPNPTPPTNSKHFPDRHPKPQTRPIIELGLKPNPIARYHFNPRDRPFGPGYIHFIQTTED